MKSVNKVILLGNVGRDPEVKSTSGGTLVANLSLATSNRFKDASGNWQDKTEWISLVAFKRTAEVIRDYVKKGSRLYVEGKIQTRTWEKDGQKQYRTEVLVNELSLFDGGKREPKNDISPFRNEPPAEVEDSEIPF